MGLRMLGLPVKRLARTPVKRNIEPGSWRSGKTTNERGYTYAWKKAREAYLGRHPLCVMCEAEDLVIAASIVDHRIPHRGDMDLFWDRENWQGLCKPHHDREKQKQEQQERDPYGVESKLP